LSAQLHIQTASTRAVAGAAFGAALLLGSDAWAVCAPAAPVSNTTVTCSGTTTNQNSPNGYGTGVENNDTVNVQTGATVTGTQSGFELGAGNTINNSGTITGGTIAGIDAAGTVTVNNFGSITGTGNGAGILSAGDVVLINNSSATINTVGAAVIGNNVTVTNSGVLSSNNNNFTVVGQISANITNNSSGTISNAAAGAFTIATSTLTLMNSGTIQETGGNGNSAIFLANGGTATITNSGTIQATGTSTVFNQFGINSGAATLVITNNQGATIQATGAGGLAIGILSVATLSTMVTNAGTILGNEDGLNTNTSGTTTLINSGTISGAGRSGVRVNSASITNNTGGLITGAVGIFSRSGGATTVFNDGTITGIGGTAIQFSSGAPNTLTLGTNSVINGNVIGAGGDIFQLGGTGTASLNVATIGAAAQYQGFSTFNKIGTSTWTLTGTNAAALPWTISGGTLSVDGSIANSTMTVNGGGTLAGGGTVGNTNVNGGTLAPGSATGAVAGPFTIQGNLSFTAASTYLVQFSSPNTPRTNVTGTATLNGATVNAVFLPGGFISKQVIILNATGAVSGIFNPTVTSNLPSIQSTLSYDNHDVFLNSKLAIVAPNGGVNQQNVANAFNNFFNTGGSIPVALATLGSAGLTQATGETATGSQQTTFDAMMQFLGVLTDPFITGRGGSTTTSTGALPYAEEDDGANAYAANGTPRSKSERDAYAAMYRKAPQVADPFAQRWSVWAAGYGGSQTTDGNAALGSNTATSRIAGTAVGADYRISPYTLAGFALAGGGTNFSVANGGTGRSDLFQAGAFIRHDVGPAYITGALAYGWQDITTDRIVTIAGVDHLHAEFNANAFSGRVEGGYRFVAPWTNGVGITPYAAAQFTTFDLPAYAEQALSGANTFAQSYGAKDVTDTRSELGIRTDKSYAMQDAILTLRGRFAWAHDFNPDRDISATFQSLPGASFVVNGAAQASDSALVTASAEMRWRNGWSAAATFEGEFSDVTRSYAGKGIVRYSW
jgi:uncharacterized protein with beta-barrel porin domain